MSDDKLRKLAASKQILTPFKQRVLWSRVTTIKQILIKHRLTTHEEFEDSVAGMVRDIDHKVEETMKKDLGLDEEG